jgi:hypothetical protein
MIGDAADALLAKWTQVADTQLRLGSPFSSACEQRKTRGIRFDVRILTPGEQHAPRQTISTRSTYPFARTS